MMISLVLLSTAVGLATPVPKIDSAQLKKLLGQWSCTHSACMSKLERVAPGRMQFEIRETTITLIQDQKKRFGYTILRLDETQLDLRKDHTPLPGDTIRGIWKIEKGELWLCLPMFGPESHDEEAPPRPKEFASPERSGYRVYVMKKIEEK